MLYIDHLLSRCNPSNPHTNLSPLFVSLPHSFLGTYFNVKSCVMMLHAAISFHITSLGIFCCGGFMWTSKPLAAVLDVTLLCFRDRLVPAMREVGKLWVFYCLTRCQMFPGCMAIGVVTVNFWSNGVIEVKRLCSSRASWASDWPSRLSFRSRLSVCVCL